MKPSCEDVNKAKLVNWKGRCWLLLPDGCDGDGVSASPNAVVNRVNVWACLPKLSPSPRHDECLATKRELSTENCDHNINIHRENYLCIVMALHRV